MYTIEIIGANTAILKIIPEGQDKLGYSLPDCELHFFTLRKDHEILFEDHAIRQSLEPGSHYEVTGSWVNFTKKGDPEFTLCLTSAVLVKKIIESAA